MIRRARLEDLAEVAALERRCYSDPWPATAFAALPENPSVYFAVSRDADGGLAGYAIAWSGAGEAELANLAVAPDARRRGVGRALLDASLVDAKDAGAERVFLEVRESNAAARALYASRGFGEVGRRKKYYRSPEEDALILRLELGHSVVAAN